MASRTFRVVVDDTMPGRWAVWSDHHGEPITTGLSLAGAQREVATLTAHEARIVSDEARYPTGDMLAAFRRALDPDTFETIDPAPVANAWERAYGIGWRMSDPTTAPYSMSAWTGAVREAGALRSRAYDRMGFTPHLDPCTFALWAEEYAVGIPAAFQLGFAGIDGSTEPPARDLTPAECNAARDAFDRLATARRNGWTR